MSISIKNHPFSLPFTMVALGTGGYQASRSHAKAVSDLVFAKHALKFGEPNKAQELNLRKHIKINELKIGALKNMPKGIVGTIIVGGLIFAAENYNNSQK